MNRLESISNNFSKSQFNDGFGLLSDDVEWMIERLEIAQKALGHVEAECTMYPANQMSIDRIVKQALGQLKEP